MPNSGEKMKSVEFDLMARLLIVGPRATFRVCFFPFGDSHFVKLIAELVGDFHFGGPQLT